MESVRVKLNRRQKPPLVLFPNLQVTGVMSIGDRKLHGIKRLMVKIRKMV